jgi:hypothetical protein
MLSRRPKSTRLQTIALLLLLGVAAASCTTTGPSDTNTTDATPGPAPDPEMYRDGMTKSTDDGLFTVALTSLPGPPLVGINTWTLLVRDPVGGLEGANLTVDAVMLEDEHQADSITSVSEEFGGEYRANPVEFDTPGVWAVEITIEHGGTADSLVFVFDIMDI